MMAENFLEKHLEDLTTISEGQSRPMTINDSKNDIIHLWHIFYILWHIIRLWHIIFEILIKKII